MPAGASETAILTTTKQVLDAVATRMRKKRSSRIAIVGFVDGEIGAGGSSEERRSCQVAAQRAVNAKAYLVKNHDIDPGRIMVRVGKGHSGVAEIVLLPDSNENGTESPWLQETSPVDENVTKPIEADLMQPAGIKQSKAPGSV